MSLDWCKICDHQNQMDDETEGHAVCLDCGLVMEPLYRPYPYSLDSIINDENEKYNMRNERERRKHGDLLNLCDKLHLSREIVRIIFEAWKPVEKWYTSNKKYSKKHAVQGLMVMVIHQSLIEQKIPRPVNHLCQEAGIRPKTVWYWSRLYYKNKREKTIDPVEMCEYFLQPLSLSFPELKQIKELVSRNKNLPFAPSTLLATCAYMFLRRRGPSSDYSLEKIAKRLGVSLMSTYRCKEVLKKDDHI